MSEAELRTTLAKVVDDGLHHPEVDNKDSAQKLSQMAFELFSDHVKKTPISENVVAFKIDGTIEHQAKEHPSSFCTPGAQSVEVTSQYADGETYKIKSNCLGQTSIYDSYVDKLPSGITLTDRHGNSSTIEATDKTGTNRAEFQMMVKQRPLFHNFAGYTAPELENAVTKVTHIKPDGTEQSALIK